MLSAYVATKLREASYKPLEDGTYFGEIPSLPGVWADGKTLETCRQELQEALEGWIVVSLRQGDVIPGLETAPSDTRAYA